MTTELNPVDKWKLIPWRKLRKIVFRLQVRIFKAQKNGNVPLVRKLQKLLLSSKAAKLLLRYWLWKFIRKQGRYNRYETNKVIKRAIPSVSWSACKFVIVKGDKSPYDGDFVYWSKRENANYDGMTARLLKKQNHKCTDCNLSFISGDIAELHHIDGNHDNWKPLNLEVLHRECHQHQTIHGRVRVRTAG
ncbi:reverse transcriptase N-terminal domain-containing protein [Nostoc sp.]|uniref:reverse transcriptase N-terminal domain-containing protein n=1 Tax=Nostoc sp. TaxID=1180 RepID=UPI002FF66DCE